jgi:hypothetical protein
METRQRQKDFQPKHESDYRHLSIYALRTDFNIREVFRLA